jgi:hypothetical protein
VRKVPGTNMLCIASILSLADKAKYSVRKILGFRDACAPSHPHHQVVNTRSIT